VKSDRIIKDDFKQPFDGPAVGCGERRATAPVVSEVKLPTTRRSKTGVRAKAIVVPEPSFNRRTQAVRRAVEILKLFSLAEPTLSLQDISDRLQLSPATAHRVIQTLEEEDLLTRVAGTETYRLGPLLPMLATRAMAHYPIRRIAGPYLRRLAYDYEHTMVLMRYEDGNVVYLDSVEGTRPLILMLRPGSRIPAHCVAPGRASLARLEAKEIERYIARGLEPCTSKTIIEPKALQQELALIRKRGYAIDDGDWVEGMRASAAAIINPDGYPIGCITALAFASDLSINRAHEIGRALQEAAASVSEELGTA
jgi:DNA-binding IclR family transcriptional regulator